MPRSSSESSSSGSSSSDSSESAESRKSSPAKDSSNKGSPVQEPDKDDPPKRRRDEKSGSKSPSPKRSKKDGGGGSRREPVSKNENKPADPVPSKEPESIMTRTGGAYIPPAKLRMMQQSITDKSSMAYQARFSNDSNLQC